MKPPHVAAPKTIRPAHNAEASILKHAVEQPDARKKA
jgi:hypothetical protein